MSKPGWLKKDYTSIPNEVIHSPFVSGNEQKIYDYILSCPEPRNLSDTDIAKGTGISRVTVIKSLKSLVDLQLIERIRGGFISGHRTKSRYTILKPDLKMIGTDSLSVQKLDGSNNQTNSGSETKHLLVKKADNTTKTRRLDKTNEPANTPFVKATEQNTHSWFDVKSPDVLKLRQDIGNAIKAKNYFNSLPLIVESGVHRFGLNLEWAWLEDLIRPYFRGEKGAKIVGDLLMVVKTAYEDAIVDFQVSHLPPETAEQKALRVAKAKEEALKRHIDAGVLNPIPMPSATINGSGSDLQDFKEEWEET